MNEWKFSELEYTRPDFEAAQSMLVSMKARVDNAASVQDVFDVITELDESSKHLMTQFTLVHIRHTIDTTDAFYEKEFEYLHDRLPEIMPYQVTLSSAIADSCFRPEIEARYGKQYFTIIDFRNVTDKFADKDFDGAPVKIKESKQDEQLSEEIIDEGTGEEQIDPVTGENVQFEEVYGYDDDFGAMELGESTPEYGKKEKVYIAGVDVSILSERRQFLDANGKLITCSLKEYTKHGILTSYRSLDNFLQAWNDAEKKQAIIEELENQGLSFDELKEEIKSDLDIFDLICHIA